MRCGSMGEFVAAGRRGTAGSGASPAVVFAAGSQTESVQVKTVDLLQHEQVTALPLTRHPDEDDKDWVR